MRFDVYSVHPSFFYSQIKNTRQGIAYIRVNIFDCLYFHRVWGPLIGILLSLSFLLLHLKNKSYMIFIVVFTSAFIIVPNPLIERIKMLKDYHFQSLTEINNRSLRERATYHAYGFEKLRSNAFIWPRPTEC